MQTLSIRETANEIRFAREYVSPLRLVKGEGFTFTTRFPDAPIWTSQPDTKYRATRQRLRAIFQAAGANVGGILRLHPEGVGKLYQRLLATMKREAGMPRKSGWQWSDETKARAAREREERRLAREAAGIPRKSGWRWSEETKARAAAKRKANAESPETDDSGLEPPPPWWQKSEERAERAIREREERERGIPQDPPPLTPEAAAESALALATAHRRIAARFPGIPASSADWLARFAASPL